MQDLTDLYQSVILDHNRRPRNRGKLPTANRVAHGEITEETKFELAALIDELAQKIERLK